jgi:lipopolysaccharide heptosyltransferase II
MIKYSNILIIQTAFIGDAILASSLVEKLHQHFPSAKISILVRKGNEGIYEQHPYLQEVLVWNKKENKLGNLFKLLKQIRFNKYDCVINCHRYASSGFLTGFSGAKHTAGYKQNPLSFLFNVSIKHSIGDSQHEIERYNQLVEDFVGTKITKPKLYPSVSDYQVVNSFQTKPYICLAPASVWFTKQLPEDKWVEVCAKFSDKQIYLLGAPNDEALCNRIKTKSANALVTVLAGKLSLLQSCALMQKADMNYVNDSAPLHLTSSVNAPVTAFFVSTVPAFGFGPLSDNSTIREVSELNCRPCGLHGFKTCPKGHFKCGLLMDVNS